jgi:hypothetical protein
MLPQQVVKVLLKLVQAVENGDDITDYKVATQSPYSVVESDVAFQSKKSYIERDLKQT